MITESGNFLRNLQIEIPAAITGDILVVCIIGLILCIIALIINAKILRRNDQVYLFRSMFLNRLAEQLYQDRLQGKELKFNITDFDKYLWPYEKMVRKFWIKDYRKMANPEFYDYVMKD
ncbi:MAG TPA: hypothetical protein P5136_01660 [Methanofastidiosum sp.]|nr:hypothetical protein [Methanofastidiosum sp.]